MLKTAAPTARDLHNAYSLANVPNLVEIQLKSFDWFLERGLKELFHNFSPIEDFTGNLSLDLVDYHLDREKYTEEECRDRDMTFERPIKARVVLRTPSGDMQETEVYLGDLPIMTERGTFVVNGVDRVVVSQLARSPGVYFNDSIDFSGRILYNATLIPSEGAWLEVETDANDTITVTATASDGASPCRLDCVSKSASTRTLSPGKSAGSNSSPAPWVARC